MPEDETLSKVELALIDKIVGALGMRSFQKLLWDKVEQAFRFTFRNTQVNYGFTHATPDPLALKYLKERTFILSDKTQDRLTGNLRWELLEGIRNTESISDIKKRLDKVFTGMRDYEIERIARTETLNAMNAGRLEAYEASEVTHYKMWRAAINNKRTAADSKRLHGQIQELGDPFVDPKTGDRVMHPPNRPNCRCAMIPLRKLPENIVYKNGLMYAADEMVGKIEIDVGSLQKAEKRVWVKATAKRKGHYRKIKSMEVKEVPEFGFRESIKVTGDLPDERKIWNDVISEIPDEELKNIKEVVFSNAEDFVRNSGGTYGVTRRDSAFFHHGNKTMYINGESVAWSGDLSGVIKHEIGHSIEPIIERELRELTWGGIYYDKKFSKLSSLAGLSESEGFAEAYRMFKGPKSDYNKLKEISPESIDFFNNLKFKEIDVAKAEKRVWVKATAKRKGHYRKVKGVKKVEESKKSAIDRLRSIIPNVYLEGATESQLESITTGVEETIGEFPDVKIDSIGWSTPDDEMLYGTPDAAYLPPTRGNPNTRIIVRKEVATDIAAWSGKAEEKFDIRKEVNIDYFHDMIKGYGGWGDTKQAEEYEEKLKNINACSRLFVSLAQEDKLKAIMVHECYHAIDVQMKLENIFLDQLKNMGVTKRDEMMVSDYAASKETELWAEAGSAIDSGVDIPDSVRKAFEATMGTIR